MLDRYLCIPDPNDVCITPDGRHALVTSSSTDRVAVVDLEKLTSMLETASPEERWRVIPNHTGKSAEFVVRTIGTRTAPRGITCSADGSAAYIASMLDDSVSVLDLRRMELVGEIDLGGSREITKRRRGETLFHSANISFSASFPAVVVTHGTSTNCVRHRGRRLGMTDRHRTLRGVNDMAP